jgi:hypothetical protein
MDLDPLHSTALISWLFVCGPIALICEDPGLGIDILHLHFFLGNIAFEFFAVIDTLKSGYSVVEPNKNKSTFFSHK